MTKSSKKESSHVRRPKRKGENFLDLWAEN